MEDILGLGISIYLIFWIIFAIIGIPVMIYDWHKEKRNQREEEQKIISTSVSRARFIYYILVPVVIYVIWAFDGLNLDFASITFFYLLYTNFIHVMDKTELKKRIIDDHRYIKYLEKMS